MLDYKIDNWLQLYLDRMPCRHEWQKPYRDINMGGYVQLCISCKKIRKINS